MNTNQNKYAPQPLPELVGAGIVAGLEVSRETNITISAGWGLSSDGYRLGLAQTTTYFYYQDLMNQAVDKVEADADLFRYFATLAGKQTIKVWEMLTKPNEQTSDSRAFKPQNRLQSELFLNDKVAVLYRHDDGRIRPLLLLKSDVGQFTMPRAIADEQTAVAKDTAPSFSIWDDEPTLGSALGIAALSPSELYNHLNPKQKLPILTRRRFGYGDLKLREMSCDELYALSFCPNNEEKEPFKYKIVNEYILLIDETLADIGLALEGFHALFVQHVGDYAVRWAEKNRANLHKRWCRFKENTASGDLVAVQYWYDLVSDLVVAYNELRVVSLDYHARLDYNPNAYANHLLLGTLPEEKTYIYPNPYRTTFRQLPIFNQQAEQLERLKFNHWRLVVMMKSFYEPTTEWDDTATDSYLSLTDDIDRDNPDDALPNLKMPIRLTPSAPLSMRLGKRAIPYYYDLANAEQSLHWYWDYDATQQNRADRHLSYHSENDAEFIKTRRNEVYGGTEKSSYTTHAAAVHPFAFDLRGLPFIRIEGHIGKIGTILITAGKADFEYKKETLGSNGNTVEIKKSLIKELQDRACQYNIYFEVEIKDIAAVNFCKLAAVEHLGGVYQGGKFLILCEEIEKKRLNDPRQWRIVADFVYLGNCSCGKTQA